MNVRVTDRDKEKRQEGIHTCNQLFYHCDRSPAEKERKKGVKMEKEREGKSKQSKTVNKSQK